MTYGYVRVSTDRQRVDNREYEIERFCKKNNLKIDEWIKETISGTKTPDKRKLGALLDKVSKGDLIICSELSRLGRSLMMIMTILNRLLENDVKVWTIKDNYKLGADIQSKVLAFAFGIAAEIERDLISQRTKEALKLKVKEGVILGRPIGRKSSHTKLSGKEKEIIRLRKQGYSKCSLGRMFNVNRMTVDAFMKDKGIK
ncbi:MAG: master DNA invertase Mpi family serine-type recombinase [Treponema sp.]|jgi:DNA invertase Pin-like site-specific DNA recombinase|nr:master DNA invertase Mpi family serine-type recombinase [Treponema sp.]